MRTITSSIEEAQILQTYFPLVKVRVEKSRNYFSDWTNSTTPVVSPEEAGRNVQPQSFAAAYSTHHEKLLTVYVSGGMIFGMVEGTLTFHALNMGGTLLETNGCKPGIIVTETFTYVWYARDTDNKVVVATIDTELFGVDDDCVVGINDVYQIPNDTTQIAIHPMDSSSVAILFRDEGGLRCVYKVGPTTYVSPNRIMPRTEIITNGSTYHFYTGAVRYLDKVWFYMSDLGVGTVLGLSFDYGVFHWGDVRNIVQADLSEVRVGNAIAANGRIFMCVQFLRREEWDTGIIHNLLLRSTDGVNFSLDQKTSFSATGYRLHIAVDNPGNVQIIIASNGNRVMRGDATWFFSSNAPHVDIPAVHIIRMSHKGGMVELVVSDRAFQYRSNELLVRGNRALLDVGYKTTEGDEYVRWCEGIIIEREVVDVDSKAPMTLRIMDTGLFFLSSFSFPFYAELQGRKAVVDDCDDLSNLYIAPGSGLTSSSITIDFWDAEPMSEFGAVGINFEADNGPSPYNSEEDHRIGFRTQDLKAHLGLNNAPIANGTVTLQLYGWCRGPDGGGDNDVMECYLFTEDEEGAQQYVAAALTSDFDHWPQEYPDDLDGSYPITWECELEEGVKILHVGFTMTADTENTFVPELLVIDNILAAYIGLNENTPWKVVEDEELTELEVPYIGRPYIMFSATPYQAFNFDVYGHFAITGAGGGIGSTYCGLVGHAEDAQNMTVIRYEVQSGDWELLMVRNGDVTVLETVNHPVGISELQIRFVHRDGAFSVLTTTYRVWDTTILTYTWEEANGGLCTHELNQHVGIYGATLPASFRIAGLDISDAEGIALAGGVDPDLLEVFPDIGEITIDDCVYTFEGRTPIPARVVGPYQGRSTHKWPPRNGHSGVATDITWYHPDGADDEVADLLLAASNGHTWLIRDTEWNAWTKTGGVIVELRNRSRHFCDAAHGNLIGASHKCVVGPGLLKPALKTGEQKWHPYGSIAYSHIEHTIRIKTFKAYDGLYDASVEDQLHAICLMAGTVANFPQNPAWDELELPAGTPVVIQGVPI